MRKLATLLAIALAALWFAPSPTDAAAAHGQPLAGPTAVPRDDPDSVEGEDPPPPPADDGESDPGEDPPPDES